MHSKVDILNTTDKQLAILIDPDKACLQHLEHLVSYANQGMFDFFMVGGSLTFFSMQKVVDYLKLNSNLPVVLFPGDVEQVVPNADAILFLSLVSGRNAEYLIGKHVLVAKRLKNTGMKIIPTGYILISGDRPSSVQYLTQTQPIPRNKPDLAAATALAAQMLGMQAIYLEAGSNAKQFVPVELIQTVRNEIEIPLIVGGGIKTAKHLLEVYNAGADIAVIGTAVEQNPHLIPEFYKVYKKVKNSKL